MTDYSELKAWLEDKKRNYSKGLKLLNQFSNDTNLKRLLDNGLNSINERLLYKELLNIYYKAFSKTETKPIKLIKRINALYVYISLNNKKLKTNKVQDILEINVKIKKWRLEIEAVKLLLNDIEGNS